MRARLPHDRDLGAFLTVTRAGRIGRLFPGGPREAGTVDRPRRARLWINGVEVGEPNPWFAHLARNHD